MSTTMTAESKFWDGVAESYAAKPVGDPDAFERKIEATGALMGPDDTLLEIGCGTGSLALRLASRAGRIHALDVSGEMVRIARAKAEAASAENVTFHEGAFDESFNVLEPGTVDGLLAFSVLHLIEDRRAALERAFSLLRPGGYFVSSTVCTGESWIPFGPIIAVMRWFGKAPWVATGLSRSMLVAEMEAAGFVQIEQPDVGCKSTVGFVVARKPQ